MLLLLAALAVAPVEPASLPAGASCRAPRVLALEYPAPRLGTSFSADGTGTLRLEVQVTGRLLPGPHDVEFRVFTPRGDLYQSLRSPVPVKSPRGRRAFVTLPVAGTAITQTSLLGRWTFTTHLDGAPAPCGTARPFLLKP